MRYPNIKYLLLFFLSGNISYGGVDIIFDYSYDTGNYFGDDQRYIMEQVAYAFESRMGGTNFSSTNPADYGGTTASNPQFTFTNPATGSTASVVPGSTTSEGNVIGNEDQLVIFWELEVGEQIHLLALGLMDTERGFIHLVMLGWLH